jgi:hypothetical protein
MRLLAILLLAFTAAPAPAARFRTIPVVVEAATPLGAYQVEIRTGGRIVGVEGGDAPFDAPPYYDPAALAGGRIILAAFSTESALSPGRHRVAVLHVREEGETQTEIRLTAAADPGGARVEAQAFVERQP